MHFEKGLANKGKKRQVPVESEVKHSDAEVLPLASSRYDMISYDMLRYVSARPQRLKQSSNQVGHAALVNLEWHES